MVIAHLVPQTLITQTAHGVGGDGIGKGVSVCVDDIQFGAENRTAIRQEQVFPTMGFLDVRWQLDSRCSHWVLARRKSRHRAH